MKKTTLKFYIDTTSPARAHLALVFPDMREETVFVVEKNLSEQIFSRITALFFRAKARLTDVNAICVNLGPGSFSGTRTGVAIANALGMVLRIPVTRLSNPQDTSTLFTQKPSKPGAKSSFTGRSLQPLVPITKRQKKFPSRF